MHSLARPLAALLLLTLPVGAQPVGVDLTALRETALAVMNDDRREHDLSTLEPDEILDTIAQNHAEDMLARDYFAHASPEGDTVGDRFREAGGRASALVAENLATCTGCPVPPGPERVRAFEEGWMESPGHRENILREGLRHFGFGIAADPESERVYAVQTFSGPGVPRGEGPRTVLDEDGVLAATRERVAALRDGGAGLEASDALAAAARRLAETASSADIDAQPTLDIGGALPEGARRDVGRIAALVATCSGCGARPTRADVEDFVARLAEGRDDTLGDAALDAIGAALVADGEGRKVMVILLAERRER